MENCLIKENKGVTISEAYIKYMELNRYRSVEESLEEDSEFSQIRIEQCALRRSIDNYKGNVRNELKKINISTELMEIYRLLWASEHLNIAQFHIVMDYVKNKYGNIFSNIMLSEVNTIIEYCEKINYSCKENIKFRSIDLWELEFNNERELYYGDFDKKLYNVEAIDPYKFNYRKGFKYLRRFKWFRDIFGIKVINF